ncbi:hypothetical protein TI03_05030, partial [Achromatium sp. WMS1]
GIFESGEFASATVANGATSANLNWSGLSGLTDGTTYARFRITTQNLTDVGGGADDRSIGGATDGEVEDYQLTITTVNYDYGDAPATYGDPAHFIPATPTVYLGAQAPDSESSAATPLDGTGDDNNQATNDEDGVTIPVGFGVGSTVSVPITIAGSGTPKLNAWFDWNRDGDFNDTGEQIATDQNVTTATTSITVNVPGTATAGDSYARFRLCSTGNCNTPTGIADDGEVEDYPISITPVITGRVFEDNGLGSGGIANNGVQDGDEIGISGVTVELTNCGATIHSSATTDDNGDYTLVIPGLGVGTSVCVKETNLPGYFSISGSGGDSGSTYDVNNDYTSFTLAADTSYTGLNFGDVIVNGFSPDHSAQGEAKAVLYYAHTFTAMSDGTVKFTIDSDVSTPDNPDWTTQLYKDSNCNGMFDGDEPELLIDIDIPRETDTNYCILVKQTIPDSDSVSNNDKNVVTIKAHFNYTNS